MFVMALICFAIGMVVILAGSMTSLLFGKQQTDQGDALKNTTSRVASGVFGVLILLAGLALMLFSSAIYVKDNQGGLVIKRFGKDLPPGRIIAVNGEKGPQARVLPPGWHFFYWPWQYQLEPIDNITIPEGKVGIVSALDGKPLPEGEIYAPEWKDAQKMLDAEEFLKGEGYQGPQLTVLKPRQYRYNNRLFKIEMSDALEVPVGKVAVIKANAGEEYKGEDIEYVNGVPMVPKYHRGLWNEALTPNAYYLHPNAYVVTFVETTNRVYSYTGLTGVRSRGDRPDQDNSISVRTKDGFEFPVDVRVSVKISAENAPDVVARLADPDSDSDGDGFNILEERVILPLIRAIFRNLAEKRGAVEYVSVRSEIEEASAKEFAEKLQTFKVSTDGVFIARIGLSDTKEGKALLDTQTQQEIAIREKETWLRKQEAAMNRAKSVRAEEEADQEKMKVAAEAQIAIEKSKAQAAIEKAEGEKQVYLKKIEALGGVDNFVMLEKLKIIIDQWNGSVPAVTVLGGSEGGSQLLDATLGTMLKEKMAKAAK
jgi:uncharacterized membrane protein YqiK